MNAVERTDVTVIGAGLMGAAITKALLRSGRSVTVWNRSLERATALEADGAVVEERSAHALRASPVAIVVIMGYDNVKALLAEASAIDERPDVVQLSTGTAHDARHLHDWCQTVDLRLLDGAIFGFPSQIGKADAGVMYSGSPEVYDTHRSTLTAIAGASRFLGPDPGLANALEASMLTVAGSAIFSSMEALSVGIAQGLPVQLVAEVIVGALRTAPHLVEGLLRDFEIDGDHPTVEATIDTWKQGTGHMYESARQAGLPGVFADACRRLVDASSASGRGGQGVTAVVPTLLDGLA
jgi:3-hydroxyisobutyrate dehydrogenase-like beta-hydroxyacid dehydrogenase